MQLLKDVIDFFTSRRIVLRLKFLILNLWAYNILRRTISNN